MENNYLIPANSKRGNLIFSLFRPLDLVIFLVGVAGTILMLLIFQSEGLLVMFMDLAPVFICSALVMPVPNQHNILTLLGAMIKFFTTQQKFRWKGWCIYESFK